jgi:hypothetical protein
MWATKCSPVRPELETSMHYFSCSDGPGTFSIKSVLGHVMPNFVFLHLVGSAGHVVHSGAIGLRNVNTVIFMLRWPSGVSIKSASGHVM